ncbi:MAG TPA: hypothetical protein VGV92_06715 [Gammaproteobacteria bacterium]|nr:hypothetical protein [Gammaproteobacteria bacterium]
MKKLLFYMISSLFIFNIPFVYADNNGKVLIQKNGLALVHEVQKVAPGWHVEGVVAGDISQTNKSYVATVLSKDKGNTITLRIYMRNPKDNSLQLFIDNPHAICAYCGGISGDRIPFDYARSKTGVFALIYKGGGVSHGINAYTQWRYQNGDFYLIGMTQTLFDKLGSHHWFTIDRDANISTLKMTEEINLPNNHKTLTCAVPQKYQNITLRSYLSDDLFNTMPVCSNAAFPRQHVFVKLFLQTNPVYRSGDKSQVKLSSLAHRLDKFVSQHNLNTATFNSLENLYDVFTVYFAAHSTEATVNCGVDSSGCDTAMDDDTLEMATRFQALFLDFTGDPVSFINKNNNTNINDAQLTIAYTAAKDFEKTKACQNAGPSCSEVVEPQGAWFRYRSSFMLFAKNYCADQKTCGNNTQQQIAQSMSNYLTQERLKDMQDLLSDMKSNV